MAILQPRKKLALTGISKENLTSLQILLELGFSKIRAEKALAATGYRTVQLASDWLLAHVQDPCLNANEPREYVLYVCPTGALAEKLSKFWSDSKELGWNGAHNCMPHITLVSFFKAPDESAENLANSLKCIVSQDQCPKHVNLEAYISPNFMGLFVEDKQAEWLRSIAIRYVNKLTSLGITAKARTTSLHLTLAHHFSSGLFQPLRSMVQRLSASSSANWELRLYSRDSQFNEALVHKVAHSYIPRENDELELRLDDYIYIPEGVCNESIDGWVEGISWLTGISGYLPLNHINRTAQSDCWTLHATAQITERLPEMIDYEILKTRRSAILTSGESLDTTDGIPVDGEPMEASQPPSTPQRQIFIVRHGERVDFTFGAWIPYCFEPNGTYIQRDLNMPKEIPTRNIQDYQNDSPLTTLGEMQANLLGDAMKSSNIKIDVAFASPSLRCVQTLSQILQGLESDVTINVEPGLIEWIAWYPNGLPIWMSPNELTKAGFNVDTNYKPIVGIECLPSRENAAQYYDRSHDMVKRMIENTSGNILIVAHAASLAACTRQLVGGRVPPAAEITRLVQRVPYLACLTAREETDGWQIYPPPFPSITHTSNSRFDWKILI